MLALAGCDVEIANGDKPDYSSNITYDTGTATVSDWGTDLKIGFSPMIGTWTYSVYDGDGVEQLAETTVTGAGVWWTNRVESTQVLLTDGKTLVWYLKCTSSGTAALCMHSTNSSGWWWYNPGDGNFWGDDSLNATYEKTYSTDGTRNITPDVQFKFTISRNGEELNWQFQEIGE